MAKRLFIASDALGTVIRPAANHFSLATNVIPALGRFASVGYELVVIATSKPAPVDDFVLALFASQGIDLRVSKNSAMLDDGDQADFNASSGIFSPLLATEYEREGSALILSESDAPIARAAELLPVYVVQMNSVDTTTASRSTTTELTWPDIAHALLDCPRTAQLRRTTHETDIAVWVNLDREADARVDTGIGFFDHMLEQLGRHGGFELEISCQGDLQVDEHHTVEDVALALGEALQRAFGDKRGIARYGFTLPMDEATAEVAIDVGGRPYLVFEGDFRREYVGGLPTELISHFFRSLAQGLGAAIQIRLRGENTHHMVEAAFKGVARALRMAKAREGSLLPSTKGVL